MGFWNEKHASKEVPGVEPLRGATSRNSRVSIADYEKKDLAYKKRIRVLRFVTRFASLILNALIIGTTSFALANYYLTKDKKLASGEPAWVTPTTLWPTFMLLAIAAITFLLNLGTLLSYCCCGVKGANSVNTVTTVLGFVFLAVHFVAWAVAAGAYRAAMTGKDLWGYSCSDQADAVQEQVKSFVDFGKLCTIQQGAWYITIIESIVYLLTFIVTILIFRRASAKKKLGKMRESMRAESGYAHDFEMGPRQGRKYMPLSGQ